MTPGRAAVGGLVTGLLAGLALLVTAVAVAPVGDVAHATAAPSGASSPAASAGPAGPEASATAPAPSGPAGSSPSPSTSAVGGEFLVGEPAPPLVLPQLGGGTIDLASLRGRPVWLAFMATWCPSCREELPRMVLAGARHADAGLVVLAVDVGEDEGTVAAYFSELGVSLPVGLDRDGRAMERWRVLALPVYFWIDPEGIIRFGAFGGVGPDVFAEGLGSILPGASPEP